MATSLLSLSLLILAATLKFSAQVENLNQTTAENQNCTHPHLQEIKEMVQEFNSSRRWFRLRGALESVLDNCSEEYRQLQTIYTWPMSLIGYYGHKELAALLLCAGLPVDSADVDGDTMLHGAAAGAQLKLVKMLLDLGADVNARGPGGEVPLFTAVSPARLDVLQTLVQAGANTTFRNNDGSSALDFARELNKTMVVEFLEQLPAGLNTTYSNTDS